MTRGGPRSNHKVDDGYYTIRGPTFFHHFYFFNKLKHCPFNKINSLLFVALDCGYNAVVKNKKINADNKYIPKIHFFIWSEKVQMIQVEVKIYIYIYIYIT